MKSSFRLSREYEVESALWNQAQAIEIISDLGHWFPFATQIGKRLRTFGKWKSMSNYQTKLLSAHYQFFHKLRPTFASCPWQMEISNFFNYCMVMIYIFFYFLNIPITPIPIGTTELCWISFNYFLGTVLSIVFQYSKVRGIIYAYM